MNILIVEDEYYTAELLKEVIEQDTDFSVVKVLASIEETVHFLRKNGALIDLMFLDIELADGHSFEIFKHIDLTIPVIFCTAYDEFALQAIKNNGIDYILKPFKDKAIHESLAKYKKLVGTIKSKFIPPLESLSPATYQTRFLTQYRDKSLVIETKNIVLFSIKYETVFVYTHQGKKYPLYKKLDYFESVCNPKLFYRINRQMLVHKKAITSFEPYANRKILLHLTISFSEKAIVSRLKVSKFKKWLTKNHTF
ncbi:MAG: LytR/AlgR family response regulator transcription factor [Chitinophagales bacterium]